jgi:hypothetical protein
MGRRVQPVSATPFVIYRLEFQGLSRALIEPQGDRVEVSLKPLVTHRFKLDQIEAAYELFGHQRDGVLK